MKLSTDKFSPAKTVGTLVDRAPPATWDRLAAGYLKRWAPLLQVESHERSLWLPVALGGYGHSRPLWWRDSLTPQQTALANRLYASQSNCSFAFGPQWPGPRESSRFVPPSIFHPTVNPLDAADSDVEFERIRRASARRRVVHAQKDETWVILGSLSGLPGTRVSVLGRGVNFGSSRVRGSDGRVTLPSVCPASRICRSPPARCRYCSAPFTQTQECDLGGVCVASAAADTNIERRYCDCHGYLTFVKRTVDEIVPPDVFLSAVRPVQTYGIDHAHRSLRMDEKRDQPYLDLKAPQYWATVARFIPLPPCAVL